MTITTRQFTVTAITIDQYPSGRILLHKHPAQFEVTCSVDWNYLAHLDTDRQGVWAQGTIQAEEVSEDLPTHSHTCEVGVDPEGFICFEFQPSGNEGTSVTWYTSTHQNVLLTP